MPQGSDCRCLSTSQSRVGHVEGDETMTTARISSQKAGKPRVMILAGLMAVAWIPGILHAQDNSVYWISMRGITEDSLPSFIPASAVQTESYPSVFQACHGRKFYLRNADAAAVSSSRASGDTVQVHRGVSGSSPQQSTVICLVQADS